ncbi:MAG: cytochrome C [Gammaproteobacteria bacterium]|nr:cytochrome C [Gammaproteobacteria bacterium]
MFIKKFAALLLFGSCLALSNISSALEINQASMLANSCASCHGTLGKSPGAIPAINGKSASFIAQSLRDFQNGSRPSTVMGRHASGYNEKEIQLIAEFFSKH